MRPDADRPRFSIELRGGTMTALIGQVALSALPGDAERPCCRPHSAQ
jgi:hypothetical protein